MSKRILLCDDELPILRAAEIKLSRAGYDVVCASDGQEGWERIEEQTPDLVITDCQMPRLDGIGLCKRIREHEHLQSLPIFMLTAKGYELSQTALAEEWGVQQLIAKPFSPRELLVLVDSVLQGSTSNEPAAAS